MPELVEQFIVTDRQNSSEQVGVATDELGRGVHDQVGTKLQRALNDRRGKSAIDTDQRAATILNATDRRQVGHRHERIGRRLKPHQVAGPNSVLPRRGVGQVDAANLPPSLSLSFYGQAVDGMIRIVGNGQDRTDWQAVKHGGDRSHA